MASLGIVLRSLVCPNCAGPLSLSNGELVLTCGHCGRKFLLSQPQGFGRFYFPASVDREQAVASAWRWLRQSKETPGDIGKARLVSAHLYYVPIWEASAFLVGWEFGQKYRTRQQVKQSGKEELLTLEMIEEGVQTGFLDQRRLYRAATDLEILGIGRPQISGREKRIPFIEGEVDPEAFLLESDNNQAEVLAKAHEVFSRPTGIARGDAKLFLLREKLNLLYYPLWLIRYRYRRQEYEVTVDGLRGVVHSARAPAGIKRKIAFMLTVYVLLAVGLAVVSWLGQTGRLEEDTSWLAGVLVCMVGAAFFLRFRIAKEVYYHEPFSY